ncbi:unnamed protein product [Blepharisma stoltei]|uniref:Uncharacterized protein n=1 Tax=Blepharisma stoltei TaxID=1481888 RepID=A0AAU9J0N1_9CILI|nr:unnamed protein product [Blepharisma stoltei]
MCFTFIHNARIWLTTRVGQIDPSKKGSIGVYRLKNEKTPLGGAHAGVKRGQGQSDPWRILESFLPSRSLDIGFTILVM